MLCADMERQGKHVVNKMIQELVMINMIQILNSKKECGHHFRVIMMLPEVCVVWSAILPLVSRVVNGPYLDYSGCSSTGSSLFSPTFSAERV